MFRAIGFGAIGGIASLVAIIAVVDLVITAFTLMESPGWTFLIALVVAIVFDVLAFKTFFSRAPADMANMMSGAARGLAGDRRRGARSNGFFDNDPFDDPFFRDGFGD